MKLNELLKAVDELVTNVKKINCTDSEEKKVVSAFLKQAETLKNQINAGRVDSAFTEGLLSRMVIDSDLVTKGISKFVDKVEKYLQ
jgi:hypothetical protein